MARSLELFLAGNVHARAVILPDGYDPDDFVRTQGREKMDELLAHALPMADYYIEQILGGKGTLEEDRDSCGRPSLSSAGSRMPSRGTSSSRRWRRQLDVDEEVLKVEIRRGPPCHPAAVTRSPADGRPSRRWIPLELSLIRMMLEHLGEASGRRGSPGSWTVSGRRN